MRLISLFVFLIAALLLAGCPPLPQVQTTPEAGQSADPQENLYGCSAE